MQSRLYQKWIGVVGAVLMMAGIVSGCAVPQFTDHSGLAWTRPRTDDDSPEPLAWSAGSEVSGLDRIPQPSPPRPLVAASDLRAPELTPEFSNQRLFQETAAVSPANTAKPEVLHVNSSTFDQHVLRSDLPVLVDFYADWCGPCKALAPTLEQVAAENPQARVVKVNIDDSPELAARYGVKSVPRLLVFKDGRYKVVELPERLFVGPDRVYAGLPDREQVFTLAYSDRYVRGVEKIAEDYPEFDRIFATVGNPTVSQANVFFRAKPWDEREKLMQEKTALGFFFSGHPYNTCRKELLRFVRRPLARLSLTKSMLHRWLAPFTAGLGTRSSATRFRGRWRTCSPASR